MREMRRELSNRSGLQLNWLQENTSRYTIEFTEQYNKWFTTNKTWIDDYLAKDLELYSIHVAS